MKARLLLLIIFILLLSASVFGKENNTYYEKVLGAWTGKCIGGGLGMPLEGAFWADTVKRFPTINGYVGYIGEVHVGWTGFLQEAEIPKTGNWEKIKFDVVVPDFDTKKLFMSPIIGLSLESYKNRSAYDIRNIKIVTPNIKLSDDMRDDFSTPIGCWFNLDGSIRIDYYGERSWIVPRYFQKFGMDNIKPGDRFVIEMEAKWADGDNKIGFAFNTMDRNGKGFGPDDDTSYQIIGLLGLEKYGADLTSTQIGQLWVEDIAFDLPNFLAEGIALERLRKGIMPPESGNHPVGEAIGGQMKGEIWGLICPGRPDLAAEYARRDGIVAHRDNGVYGEMFVAAMISQAFVTDDIRDIINTGLKYIPSDSKYSKTVTQVISDWDSGKPWYNIIRDVKKEYPSMCDPVYPEAAIITLALLEGRGDFDNTIKCAFYCGSDTDCNTATVGAILGTIKGFDGIDKKWSDPIGDIFRCFVKGHETWSIRDLSKRICKNGDMVMRYHGKGNKFTENK